MAAGKSGSFIITNTGQSGLSMGATRVTWAEEYDVSSNTSTVKITKLELLAAGDGYGNRNYGLGNLWFNGSVSINGTVVATVTRGSHFLCVPEYNAYKELSISSPALPWSASVAHNSDGSKSVDISVSLHALSSNNNSLTNTNINGSATVVLTTIPRASTLTVSNGTIGSAISITINRASTAFTHKLTYSFGGASGTISSNAATSASWTPPMSLCSKIPNAASGRCTITCESYNGSTKIGSTTKTITLTCPASVKPSVASGWATAECVNPASFDNAIKALYVQGYSKAKITLDSTKVTHSYGASTASTKITFGGKDYTDTTPVLTAAGKQSIVVTLTDSRGRTASQTVTFTVLPYSKPSLSRASAFRCNEAGEKSETGTFYKAHTGVSYADLGGNNTVTIRARHKTAGGSYGAYTTLEANVSKVIGGGLILSTATYIVEISVTDLIGNRAVNTITLPTASVGMHLRRDHNGAAFGKYCEHENALELPDGWQILVGSKSVAGRVNLDKASAGAVYDTVSVPSGSWKTVASLTLETGYYYVCDFCVRFATNATGWRGAVVSQVADASTQDGVISNDRRNAVNGSQTFLHVMFFRKGDGVTRYFNAYQNSGGALDAVPRVAYIAIPLA